MAQHTPLNTVKEQHGSKTALIDKIVGLIDRPEYESEDEHKRRLKNVSNSKLLHLAALGDRAKALGGRDGMVRRILELKGQPKDHEYADKLKTYTLGRLVDMVGSLERRAKKPASKQARQR